MSLPLSATIHIEDGTVVVEYTKATSYYTKTGGDSAWLASNFYKIQGSSTDSILTLTSIGTINLDSTSWHVLTNPINAQASQISAWFNNQIVNRTSDTTYGDIISAFIPNTYASIDANILISAVNAASVVYSPDSPTTITLSTKIGDQIVQSDQIACGLNYVLTGNPFDFIGNVNSSPNYYSRGLITHVLGMNFSAPYDPMNPTGLAQFQWDWSNPIDATVATCLATAAFTATAGFGLEVGVILRTGGLTPYFFGAAGTTATVTLPIYEPEIESTIPKVQNIILNGIDSLPNTLNETSLVQFQNAIAQNAPNFSQLTISQQNLLIYQKLAVQTQGLTTQINIMLRTMNNGGTVNYSNEFVPKLLDLYYRWYNNREAYQQAIFNLSNSNEPTIH